VYEHALAMLAAPAVCCVHGRQADQNVKTPFTWSNRLYNRFDNRLHRVNKHPNGYPTGCQTVLKEQPLFVQPVWQPAVYTIQPGCQTGLTTGWMFVYKPVVVSCIQTFNRLSIRLVWQPVWQHRTSKIGNIGACWNIGVGKPPMSMLSKIVVLLRPRNFHCHRSGRLPLNLTMFSAVFLGAVSWKLSLTILCSCDSHLNVASFDPAWTHGDTALLPRASLPHSRDSVSRSARLSSYAAWTSLVAPFGWPRRSQPTGFTAIISFVWDSRWCDEWRHCNGPSVGSPRTSFWICWTLLRHLLRSPT